jgi:hypothetical protein
LKALRGRGVSPLLNQDIERDAVLVHSTPEIEQLAVDPQVNLIHVPGIARPLSTLAQLGRELSAKAEAPAADALVADHHALLGPGSTQCRANSG